VIHPSLDDARRALLAEARDLVARAGDWAKRLEADPALARALEASRGQLDEGFLLVVVGEFNSGKSSFVNALLGEPLLAEGVTPTTSRIALLRFGEERARHLRPDGVEVVLEPAELLRAISIVDTPGTNAVLREHEALTRDFVPRADLVVFLTSSDRPYTETEREFLEALREWGKKVVVVVNKADLLETAEDRARVLDFVREQAGRTLGTGEPEVFALSARLAVRGRGKGDAAALEASGLPAFEARVTARLDEAERFRLKLQNPVGVARRVAADLQELVHARRSLVEADVATLEAVERLLAGHGETLARDFRLRLADVEKVLLDFERRGSAFFDDRLRLSHFRELFDRDRLRRDFEATVVAELPREVERRVEAVVDWMVAEDLRLWQEVMRLLRERQGAHADRLAGAVDDRFAYDRQRRIESLWQDAQRAVETYDPAAEARRLAEQVRETVASAALLQVSALGLGAMVAVLAGTTAADVTGFLTAGVLSVVGLLVLPARREKARRELSAKVQSLRGKLVAALTASFERERERSLAQVRASIEPYAAFVRAEQERLGKAAEAIAALASELERLSTRVEVFGRPRVISAPPGAP
jgi:GTP-binding protein EngB required for normal cell division